MNSLKDNMKWSIVYWCGTILQMGQVGKYIDILKDYFGMK